MNRRKYDRERKREQRRLNTPYAQRVRVAKRTEEYKAKRRLDRQDPCVKEKERIYQSEYRKRPEVIAKTKARHKAKWALMNGKIKRPGHCEVCGEADKPLRDGRSGLRMDHFLGYDEANYLKVKFVCITCDGKQLRKKYD